MRKKYGWNELEKEEGTPLWKLVLEQFDDALVKILLVAAAVSFLLAYIDEGAEAGISAYVEPLVILIILILNAMVGVWQESNAEAALEALKDLQPENARCLRDGEMVTIPTRELIPGDIVEVRVGDKVPADMRLVTLKTTALRVEQAQMTGESQSVNKDIDQLPSRTEEIIQAKTNMLFATTIVVNGVGQGVVVHTGMDTEIGQIQKSVQEAAEDDDTTPLKRKLDEFGELLSKVILVICIIVWVINYKNFFDPIHGSVFKGCIYYFKIAVALAVAAIPEGLPAVITTCLALGTRKMAKKNAIVRKLPSVETLGCTTVICSDKTGTLTTNEMSCVSFSYASTSESNLETFDVEGTSYSPVSGQVLGHPDLSVTETPSANMLATICSLCNQSTIEYHAGKYQRVGEPTEAAMKVLSEKLGLPDAKLQRELVALRQQAQSEDSTSSPVVPPNFCAQYWNEQYETLAILEFSRDRKSMSVLCSPQTANNSSSGRTTRSSKSSASSNNVLFVKGAPESIVGRCTKIQLSNGTIVPLTAKGRKAIDQQVTRMAGLALRCLGLAFKELETGPLSNYDGDRHHPAQKLLQSTDQFSVIESDLVFVGLTGMIDPPRPEVLPMIEVCHTAGIRVIVITGDNQLTAEAICRKIGIFGPEENDLSTRSFTGAKFFAMSEEAQIEILMGSDGLVFSRTEPKHKQKLVKMLKREGEVVAMTGDGVNDAPALKQADIVRRHDIQKVFVCVYKIYSSLNLMS